MVKRETNLNEKNRLLENKGQKGLQLGIHTTIGQKTNQLKTA